MQILEALRSIPGPTFLGIMVGVIVITTAVHVVIRNVAFSANRAPIPEPESLSPVKSAVLRGDRKHVLLTILFSLYKNGEITLLNAETPIVTSPKKSSHDTLTAYVFNYLEQSPKTPDEIFCDLTFLGNLDRGIRRSKSSLEKVGLLKTETMRVKEGRRFLLAMAVILISGLPKLAMGLYYGKPSIFLFVLILFGLFLQYVVSGVKYAQTQQGMTFLIKQEQRFVSLRGAANEESATKDQQLYLISVFGAAALTSLTTFIPFSNSFPGMGAMQHFTAFAGSNRSGRSSGNGCGNSCSSCSSGCSGGGSSCSSCGGGCGGCGGCGGD